MLSNSLKYALRALIFLVKNSDSDKKWSITAIAEATQVPHHYLGKLLQLLVKNEIISSKKGPNGGFYLTAKNRSLKLSKVVYLIDDQSKFDGCPFSFEGCNPGNPCPLHDTYLVLKAKFNSEINSKSIGDL